MRSAERRTLRTGRLIARFSSVTLWMGMTVVVGDPGNGLGWGGDAILLASDSAIM
jgi:hypothetical protein